MKMNKQELDHIKQEALKRYDKALDHMLGEWNQKTAILIKHELGVVSNGSLGTTYEVETGESKVVFSITEFGIIK